MGSEMCIRDRYRGHYQTFMKELFEKGHAERVPPDELSLNNGGIWYIPHHGVYHPQKQDKIRVVFDASAEFKGKSLNRYLLQGPDLKVYMKQIFFCIFN